MIRGLWRTPFPLRRLWGVVLTLVGIGSAVLALVPFRSSVDGSLAALVLVVPVAVGVAVGGLPVAPVGIVAGFLAYDFFFIPPYDTFRVAGGSRWVSLAVYTAVALIVGGVVAQVQSARAEAEARESELGLLYELARAVSDADDLQAALRAVARLARRRLDLTTVAVLLPEPAASHDPRQPGDLKQPGDPKALRAVAVEGQALPERDLQRLVAMLPLRDVAEVPGAPGLVAAPLPTSTGPAGVLAVTGTGGRAGPTGSATAPGGPSATRLLALFAAQAGHAIERARLAEETSRSTTLAEVDRLRSALMGAVSHDLRTPLASIKASVSDLADPAVQLDDEDRRVLLGTIEEETDRLTRLVSNLLDMGRIEAGALTPAAEATPIDELIDTVVARFAPRFTGRISVSIQPGLPFFQVDYLMVDQVIANLLENVLRHCPEGTNVEISARQVGAWGELRVADDGPGIAAADRDKIFHRFVPAGRTGGTGMGLAICQGIVEAHGGTMWVERAANGGSAFVFRLPLSVAAPAVSEPDVHQRSGPEPQPPPGDRTQVDAHP